MTAVVLEVCPAPAGPDPVELVGQARRHRPYGREDLCRACGWHWPCPAFFAARYALIAAGVDPELWA